MKSSFYSFRKLFDNELRLPPPNNSLTSIKDKFFQIIFLYYVTLPIIYGNYCLSYFNKTSKIK
jgi:hypothetical protein